MILFAKGDLIHFNFYSYISYFSLFIIPKAFELFQELGNATAVFCDEKVYPPIQKTEQNYLNFKKFGAKELPLPGAGQEDPDAVVAALALQRNPLLQQVVLQRLAILRVAVPGREEPVERLGNDVLRVARNRCRAGVLVRV